MRPLLAVGVGLLALTLVGCSADSPAPGAGPSTAAATSATATATARSLPASAAPSTSESSVGALQDDLTAGPPASCVGGPVDAPLFGEVPAASGADGLDDVMRRTQAAGSARFSANTGTGAGAGTATGTVGWAAGATVGRYEFRALDGASPPVKVVADHHSLFEWWPAIGSRPAEWSCESRALAATEQGNINAIFAIGDAPRALAVARMQVVLKAAAADDSAAIRHFHGVSGKTEIDLEVGPDGLLRTVVVRGATDTERITYSD
jgi:hypothetical protein